MQGGVGLEGGEGCVEDGEGVGVGGRVDAVVHPFAVAAGGDDAGFAQVGEVAGDLGLGLPEDFDEVADADFAAVHEVEEAQAGGVGERGEEQGEVEGLGAARHGFIICGLTDVCDVNTFVLAYMLRGGFVTSEVQEKYGAIARTVTEASAQACCDRAMRCCDPITKNLYGADEKGELPEKAVLASLGCGNPTALIELKAGETVLDLGSGGGIDVLLSARRVGPTGKAYGLDMTDDMLALARENQRQAGAMNIEFLKGEIEAIPLPDASVDVVISNCVINLSGGQEQGAAGGVPGAAAWGDDLRCRM